MKNLIALNIPEGLQNYIDAFKRIGGVMDCADGIGEVTDAISAMNDISLLPLLLDVVRLRFSDSFKDGSFHTLYNSLYKALSACAKIDFNLVWNSIDELKGELTTNLEAIGFRNTLQNDILESNTMSLIRESSLPEGKDVLRKVD